MNKDRKQIEQLANDYWNVTPDMADLTLAVRDWAVARDLIDRDNVPAQFMKMIEEVGELSRAIQKNNTSGIIDGLGDTLVTVIILAYQLGYTPRQCLQVAYNEISKRTGRTVGGVFVKDPTDGAGEGVPMGPCA